MANTAVLRDQIIEQIRDRIHAGSLPAGSRMPGERTLSEELGVSRVTLRHALKDLEDEGLIEVLGGVRWVRRRAEGAIEEGATGLISFADLAANNGLTVSSRVLRLQVRPSTFDEADVLSIAPGAPVVDLVRLRFLNDIPIVVDHSLIPESVAPGLADLDFRTVSLYETFVKRYGMRAFSAECAIEARGVTEELAGHLGLTVGAPVLEIIQTTIDDRRRVIQWCRSVYRGDRYRFRAVLEGSGGAQLAHRTVAETAAGAARELPRSL